jgi:PQQ-like domain
VKIVARLSALATVTATGLTLAATGAAAAPATPAAPGAGHGAAVTSGTKLWEARYAASGRGAFSLASAVSPDGSTLFLTGGARRKVHESGAPSAGATLAYNPATGAKLWQANYNPGGLSTSSFSAIAVSPDSSTVFVFSAAQAFSTVAYDAATGAEQWFLGYHALSGAWHSFASSIEVSPDGSEVFVTGDVNTPEPGTIPTMTAVAYSS